MSLSLAPVLAALLDSLPSRPVDQETLVKSVKRVLLDSKNTSTDENRKSQWEYLLKDTIFTLARKEGAALKDGTTTYYDELRDTLDLILIFTEQDACEQVFPFTVLQDLLETQTITSCSHIFSWIEERSKRLTSGMVPQKGKALVLLRTLNDLLRRLSKMGSTTIFCGRILTFLSGVFPLGERSGVNLRGEYGPAWEGVKSIEKVLDQEEQSSQMKDVVNEVDKMEVDSEKLDEKKSTTTNAKPLSSKEDFYSTFWSLQLPFSRPPRFALPNAFSEFKESVNAVLPYIKEANAKDRAMLGSRSGAGASGTLKRKREPEDTEESTTTDYFFAKFLTSPELLELEIADTHFRRQFLFQLLILLNHLLNFTKPAKALWSTPRNRSLQMDFTLEPLDAQWAQETVDRAMDELRQTTPNGRAFSETVNAILEREKNWVKWKNELCSPFDKESWFSESEDRKIVGLEESARAKRKNLKEPKDWPWKMGSEPLSEIWQMGYQDLRDLENVFHPGEVKDYAKKVQLEDARIDMRKKTLAKNADRLTQARVKAAANAAASPAPGPPSALPEVTVPKPETSVAPTPSRPPQPGLLNSPLHPSLPPKPSSPSPQRPPTLSSQTTNAASSATVVAPTPAPAPVPVPAPFPAPAAAPVLVDDQLAKFEENKQRWSWLALRTARDSHLQHFGKIGTGDVLLLAQEIEKEKDETKVTKAELQEGGQPMTVHTTDDYAASPMPTYGKDKEDERMEGVEEPKGEDIKPESEK